MSRPLVSVVLPVYNGQDFIESAVHSILDQDVDLEVIISDDCSKDRTVELVEAMGSKRVTIIRNKTQGGQFVNFNRALAQARGQYVQCFSHDDVAHQGFLQSQIDSFNIAEAVGLVYCSCRIIDVHGRQTATLDDEGTPELIDFPTYLLISSRHGALPPSISSVMVTRDALNTVGLFDERFAVAGDLEFFNRVAERFKLARNRSLLLSVRVHPNSVTSNSESPLKYMREEVSILPFYRRNMGEHAYQEMIRARARGRGADHAKYLIRRAMAGDWKRLWAGYKLLSQAHNVPTCVAHAVAQGFGFDTRRG